MTLVVCELGREIAIENSFIFKCSVRRCLNVNSLFREIALHWVTQVCQSISGG